MADKDYFLKFASEDEQRLRERYRELITLLENAEKSSNAILKAITPESSKHQIVKTMLHICGFLADLAGSTYWREIARALKKLYLHLLVKQPIPKNFLVTIIGASSHDIEEWRAILGPDVFPYLEATFKDLIKSIPSGNRPSPKLWYALRRAAEKNNFVPSYCCKAVDQFFELVKENMLPYYCPAHEKFFWTRCPVCICVVSTRMACHNRSIRRNT